jgi:hypothetical protein
MSYGRLFREMTQERNPAAKDRFITRQQRRTAMKRAFLAVLLGALILTGPAAAAQKPLPPVGQITFEATSVGVGATMSWGKGWLTFKGKSYPILVQGLGVVGLGLSQVKARGKVYNLKRPADIVGDYAEAGAGIAVVGGVKGFVAKSQKGVVLDLTAEQTGVSFNIGGGAFTITMPRPNSKP